MAPPISFDEEHLIFHFSGKTDNISEIRRLLISSGYRRSRRGILLVLQGKGKKREARRRGLKYKCQRKSPVLTKEVLNRIKKKVLNKGSVCFEELSKQVKLPPTTVKRAVKKRLKLKRQKKVKVHHLEPRDMKNRKTNSRKLYDVLRGERSKYVVSLDESRIYFNSGAKGGDYYYVEPKKEGEKKVQDVKECYPKNFMIIGSMTENTTFPLMKVPTKVTVDAKYYIDHVLDPLIHKNLIRYFGKDIDKVVIHNDKAPSHSANLTRNYLMVMNQKYGIRFIEKEDIPVKGADISPLDFFGFGWIKQKLKYTRARTENGVWKSCRDIWNQVTPETCKRVFALWKRRCRAVFRNDGQHVEQTKQIHRRKINKLQA